MAKKTVTATNVEEIVGKMAKAMHEFLLDIYRDGTPSINDMERAVRVGLQHVYIPAANVDLQELMRRHHAELRRLSEQNADLSLTVKRQAKLIEQMTNVVVPAGEGDGYDALRQVKELPEIKSEEDRLREMISQIMGSVKNILKEFK